MDLPHQLVTRRESSLGRSRRPAFILEAHANSERDPRILPDMTAGQIPADGVGIPSHTKPRCHQ